MGYWLMKDIYDLQSYYSCVLTSDISNQNISHFLPSGLFEQASGVNYWLTIDIFQVFQIISSFAQWKHYVIIYINDS